MRLWILLSAVSLFAVVLADEISVGLSNPELVAKTVDCLEDKAPCTKFGEKAKVVLSQIARTGVCRSCSKEEQDRAYDIIKRFRKQDPAVYKRLLAKYRPTGVPQEVPAPLKELAGDHPNKPIKG
uniref:Chemosensory protein n=1 Tax=Strigamia maritima TaxID=126957 RepID=T1JF81_STRMM